MAASPTESHGSGATPGSGQVLTDVAGSGAAIGAEDQNGNKRRKSGPGSRGVANLTPAQLAKKRANDREAQRAIRERQKQRNEQYEREIRELKSQRPYQELQAALQQTAAVQAELDNVKRILASVVSMIEPVLGRSPVPAYQQHQQHQNAVANTSSAPTTNAPSPASTNAHGRWQHSDHSPVIPQAQPQSQPQDATQQLSILAQQQHDLLHGLELGPERLGLDFVLDPSQKVVKIHESINGAQDTPQYRHLPMKHDWTAASMPIAIPTLPPPSNLSNSSQSFITHPLPDPGLAAAPFKNCPPTCPLDSLLLDFLSERRQRAAEGLSTSEILGPRYPSVSSLLNPALTPYSHPLSKVFTDILARFPDISALPERVAVLYIMFLIMRWQVSPTPENYARLPDWCRGRDAQLSTPHPAWMDHIPFPAMRDYLIAHYGPGQFPFENFFIPFTTTLRVNWPYEDVDTLLRNPVGEELMINPVFERHLRRLENWTLGDAFEDAFPPLNGTYNLLSERRGGRRFISGEWGREGVPL
ncbi:AP-1-like transcription factor [Podospora aff. communis PSN243]|uniref:AP-1-like transcription factor n=1 Tax=Podospora aff. communis PSN243 TaxID=3040156 RepID=A0AAV9H4X4_9PEZI|nr:AP-1-like transcription factor [Podospora aff. communis PSN243]